jgi:hypothetical protein
MIFHSFLWNNYKATWLSSCDKLLLSRVRALYTQCIILTALMVGSRLAIRIGKQGSWRCVIDVNWAYLLESLSVPPEAASWQTALQRTYEEYGLANYELNASARGCSPCVLTLHNTTMEPRCAWRSSTGERMVSHDTASSRTLKYTWLNLWLTSAVSNLCTRAFIR